MSAETPTHGTTRKRSDPTGRDEAARDVSAEVEQLVDERTAGLQKEIDALRRENEMLKQAKKDPGESGEYAKDRSELNLIYTSALVGLCLLGTDTRYLRVNQQFAEMNGFSIEEHIGKRVRDLVPSLAEVAEELTRKIVETGEPVLDIEINRERPAQSGVERYWKENWWPLKDGQGRVVAINIVAEEITEHKRVEEALRQAQARAQADLDAMTQLQRLGMLSMHEKSLEPILLEIVDTARAISGADFGNIQFLDEETGDLTVVAQRGFPDWWVDYWNGVGKGQGSCSTTLKRGERVIVEDVEQSPDFAGKPGLEVQLKAGVRACQSTVLVSRSGKPQGVLSTHYRRPHRPDARTLRLLDLLGRQAADIIEWARSEEALCESETRFRAILEHSLDAAYRRNLQTDRYDYMSPVIEQILGFTAEEMNAMSTKEVLGRIHPDDRPPVEAATAHTLASGRGLLEYRFKAKDGRYRWLADHFTVTRDADGRLLYRGGIVRDVTEKKQREERICLHQAVMDGINRILSAALSSDTEEALGAVCLDVAEMITQSRFSFIGEINEQGLQEIAVSNPGWDAYAAIDPGRHRRPAGNFPLHGIYGRVLRDGRSLFTNEPASHPDSIGTPPGHPPLTAFLGVPLLREGRTIGMIAVANREGGYTITEQTLLEGLAPAIVEAFQRKRAEEELVRHTEDLVRLHSELQIANREANLYLDILTHDIGNTENVSNLYADLLIDSLQGKEVEYVKKLQRSVQKSIEILGTVSTIRRIHQTSSELKPTDLDAAVCEVIEDFPSSTILYDSASHQVRADDLLPVVFSNLIGNAVKFGDPDVKIAVRVDEEDGVVRVSVEDTGPGVPDDEKDEIFHRYEQQKRGVGEGLGLYLVQILVERYGGKVWVEDRVPGHPEKGAAFKFTLRQADHGEVKGNGPEAGKS